MFFVLRASFNNARCGLVRSIWRTWALFKHSLKLRQILRIVDFSVFLGVIIGACSRASTAFANKALENEALMRFSTRLIKLVARASELTKGVTPASSSETKTVMTTKLRPVADGIAAVAYAFHPLVKKIARLRIRRIFCATLALRKAAATRWIFTPRFQRQLL